jgi:hypothetical protein
LLEESGEGDVLLKGYKKKIDEQSRFIENTTLDDVLVDKLKPILVGQNPGDMTYLPLINGCNPKIAVLTNSSIVLYSAPDQWVRKQIKDYPM